MGYLFLIIASWAAFGIYRMVRSSQQSQRYLVQSPDDAPLQTEHLSPPLANLVQETRLLRISLDSPIREIEELLGGIVDTTSTNDLDGIDTILMNISRQLTDWLQMIDRLPPNEREHLRDLGLSSEPMRQLMLREGWSFERQNLRGPGEPMHRRLRQIATELQRVETQLQATSRIYR